MYNGQQFAKSSPGKRYREKESAKTWIQICWNGISDRTGDYSADRAPDCQNPQ